MMFVFVAMVLRRTRALTVPCMTVSPRLPRKRRFLLENSTEYSVDWYGELEVLFHSKQDVRITPTGVAFIPGLGCNLFDLHAVQVN